jgi:RNA polymerase sigma-70 factor (ECF subfamily)
VKVRRRRLAAADGRVAPVGAGGPARGHVGAGADGLLSAVAGGDRGAFAELYDLVSPTVFGLVRSVVRDRAMAEEVTQEVFAQVWRLAPRFEPSAGSATAWVHTLAHRRAVDRVRSEQASRRRIERAGRLSAVPPDEPDEAVVEGLDRQRVRAALAGLTERQRRAIELAYYGGHTYEEVAVLLDIPTGTAKTRIRDGLIRLRDALGAGDA